MDYLHLDEEFVLSVSAYDREDGVIDEQNIVWTDPSQTIIGYGKARVVVTEAPVLYKVTATDSKGYSSEKTVSVISAYDGCDNKARAVVSRLIATGSIKTCIASERIRTRGYVNVQDNARLEMFAPTVVLGAGFRAADGSTVRVAPGF